MASVCTPPPTPRALPFAQAGGDRRDTPAAAARPRVRLCAGCAIPSAPKRAREGQHRSQSGTQEGQARPASACARVRQACARGASVAGEGAGSGDGTPTRVMGEEA